MLVMHSVRGAAHELNNVLQMISGSAELLELNPECPASMMPRLQAIGNHTGRGCELVAAIADMARAHPPRGNVTDIGKAIERVRQLRRFEQSRAGVDLQVEIPAGACVLRADPLDVQLMLLNLVISAEQAVIAAESKTIVVAVASDDAACRITVKDSGGGQPAVERSASTRSPLVGAALGSAATEALARRNGGAFAVHDTESGTEAQLTLPIARNQV
jgi:signal transduction histidine kinase